MENVTLSHQDPAKRMQTIREWVGQGSVPESERSGAVALTLLTDLNKLQDRVADIEARQDLEEPPFVSPVPVIGRLIVWMRSAWNWMSTKWYVRPLIQQQTNFNAAAVQAWTDMLAYLESVVRFARAVYGRLDDLEDRLDELAKAQMVAQRPVAMPPVEFADATSLVENAVAGWIDLFAAGPVVVLSCGRGEAVRTLAEQGMQVSGAESDAELAHHWVEGSLDVVHSGDVEYLASLPEGELGGVLAVWSTPMSAREIVRLLDQCRRVLQVGAWTIWVWPWAATLGDTTALAARDIALGMEFRRVRLEADQHAHSASQILLLQR
jgi:hypothetical protein